VIDAPDSDAHTVPTDHSGLAAKRSIIGIIAGLVAAGLSARLWSVMSVTALSTSDVAGLVFVAWVWVTVAAATARIARAEDASRGPRAAETVLVGAGAASLVTAAFTLAPARHSHARHETY
jgi:hypothetical protein